MDAVVGVGVGGDLGEVGDAEDLAVLGDLVDFAADDFGYRAAYSGVDFVATGLRWRPAPWAMRSIDVTGGYCRSFGPTNVRSVPSTTMSPPSS